MATISVLSAEPITLDSHHLSRHDLDQCVLVNKEWMALCTPAPGRIIDIMDSSTLFRFKELNVLNALSRNAMLVQERKICYFFEVPDWLIKLSRKTPLVG